MQHELAKRIEQGVTVRLLWDSHHDRVTVRYRDARTGDTFTAEVPNKRALLAFEHPNAYRSDLAVAV
jgi:hypothetical protein